MSWQTVVQKFERHSYSVSTAVPSFIQATPEKCISVLTPNTLQAERTSVALNKCVEQNAPRQQSRGGKPLDDSYVSEKLGLWKSLTYNGLGQEKMGGINGPVFGY